MTAFWWCDKDINFHIFISETKIIRLVKKTQS